MTPLGGLVLIGSVSGIRYYGYAELDLVAFSLSCAGCVLLLSSATVVLLGRGCLRRATRRMSSIAGSATKTTTAAWTLSDFTLPSLRWLPLVHVSWRWLAPPQTRLQLTASRGAWQERVWFSKRGVHGSTQRAIVVRDVFGLTRSVIRHHQLHEWQVLPHRGLLRSTAIPAATAAGDEMPYPLGAALGDRVDTRRYAAGDAARFIHWKALARTGKLIVRQPERAVQAAFHTAAYLIAAPGDEASAAAARVCIEGRQLGAHWTFCADGSSIDANEPESALHQVAQSSAAQSIQGNGLHAFVERMQRNQPGAAFIVFAPELEGEWMTVIRQTQRRLAAPILVVIGTDQGSNVAAGDLRNRLPGMEIVTRRLAKLVPMRRRQPSSHGLRRASPVLLATELESAGCRLVILDRSLGTQVYASL